MNSEKKKASSDKPNDRMVRMDLRTVDLNTSVVAYIAIVEPVTGETLHTQGIGSIDSLLLNQMPDPQAIYKEWMGVMQKLSEHWAAARGGVRNGQEIGSASGMLRHEEPNRG